VRVPVFLLSAVAHLGGSRRCTNGLNLGPVSERSGGKVVARIKGLCELLTPSRHRPV
jgi:hypothetical protein